MYKIISFLIALSIGQVCYAADMVYPFDLVNKDPALKKMFNQLVKEDIKDHPWLKDMGGVTVPIENVNVAGNPVQLLHIFQPHESFNRAYFILRADKSAVGIHIEDVGNNKLLINTYGKPTSEELRFMLNKDQDTH